MSNVALRKPGSTPRPRASRRLARQNAAYYMLAIGLGLSMTVLGPTLPSLAEQTGSRLGLMGLLFLASWSGPLLGTVASGPLYDRLPGHRVLAAAQIAAAGLIALLPLAPSLWLLLLLLVVQGFARRLVSTGTNMLLNWAHGDGAGPYINALHFFLGLGAFLAPLIVGWAIDLKIDYRWTFWAMAVYSLLIGLFVLSLPPGPTAPAREKASPGDRRSSWGPVVLSALFLFFYVSAELGYGNWLYTYATELDLAGPAAAAYLTSALWLSFTVGRLISIATAARFAPRRVLPVALTGCLAFTALLLGVPRSSDVLWAATIGLGFCMAPLWPTGFTLAGKISGTGAHTTSLVMIGDNLGAMLVPWLVGEMLDVTGPRILVYFVLGSLAADTVCALLMARRAREKETSP